MRSSRFFNYSMSIAACSVIEPLFLHARDACSRVTLGRSAVTTEPAARTTAVLKQCKKSKQWFVRMLAKYRLAFCDSTLPIASRSLPGGAGVLDGKGAATAGGMGKDGRGLCCLCCCLYYTYIWEQHKA
jgi:hypothetical protein